MFKTKHARLLLALVGGVIAPPAFADAFAVGDTIATSDYITYWRQGTEPIPTPQPFYKAEFGGVPDEEGDWSPYFATVWADFDGASPGQATITWESGFDFDLTGIWLKASTGEWFAVDVGQFDIPPYYSIELYAPLYDKDGSGNVKRYDISHVTLIGTSVPDGGTTMLLLGSSMLVLGFFGRRKN